MLPSPSDSPGMSDVRVSVVLTPLSSGHTLARTFTLSEDHPDFEIGRSSKRDVKNRSPASDNGWFDSGVMSRTHAKFSLEEKHVYICDTDSTHGTWLNNVKLVKWEPAPLINGDVLRFGITVDRGHEIIAPLTVACKFEWFGNTDQSLEAAELMPTSDAAKPKISVDSRPLPSLRPVSTNTFCVPEDSDVEEMPNPNIDLPDEAVDGFHAATLEASREAGSRVAKDGSAQQESNPPQEISHKFQAQHPGCIILERDKIDYLADEDDGKIDYSDEDSDDFVDSDEEESDLESSAPSSSGLSSFNRIDIGNEPKFDREGLLDYSASGFESDDECAASSHGKLLDNVHTEFINPDVLMQNDCADAATFAHASESVSEDDINSAAPATTEGLKLSPEKPGTYVEICGGIHLSHPHSVVASGECSQRLPTLESNQQPAYEDGPFSSISEPGQDGSTIKQPVVNLPAWPLKRKISEMETQDAQIVDSILPATQADLDSLAKPEVVDAISSALSESEPPKKRVKSSHSPSGTMASYTATAVISALLGGLGTIALLAALPAEYFQ